MVNGELVTSRPRSNHSEHFMLYDGKHKEYALIDEETFNKVSERFTSDKTKHNLKLYNPLAGIFSCKKCGKMMHYQRYTTKQNVQPRFTHKHSQICKVKSVLATDVMNAVVHALKLYIEDFSVKINNLPQTDENEIAKEIESLTTELMKIEKKLSKLFDAWEDEQISDNEFVKRKAVNNQRVENIKAEIEKLENSIPEKEEYEEKIMALSDALDSLLDENIDADIQNEYLKQIIDKIEFSRENNKEFILDVFLK